jgi:hypothetical protein
MRLKVEKCSGEPFSDKPASARYEYALTGKFSGQFMEEGHTMVSAEHRVGEAHGGSLPVD